MSVQGRGEETKAHILEAAVSAFAQYGYDGTGVAEICKSAGISKGAFYHHFESKQALYLELLNDWLRSIDEEFEHIQSSSQSTIDALVEMAKVFSTLFEPTGSRIAVFIEFLTRAAREKELRAAALEPYRRYQKYFAHIIERGVREGTIQTDDPQQAARLLVSMAVGLILNSLIDPESSDWRDQAERAATLFIREFMGT